MKILGAGFALEQQRDSHRWSPRCHFATGPSRPAYSWYPFTVTRPWRICDAVAVPTVIRKMTTRMRPAFVTSGAAEKSAVTGAGQCGGLR